jgi:ribonucleotide monophosphatase NagD (HAD superfamily)
VKNVVSCRYPEDKKVYVVGETGILEELDGVGISYLGRAGTSHSRDIYLWLQQAI